MRVTDRSPTGRRLQTVFIPAEPKPVMPTEVSDEIVLVHPVMPPMVGFKEGRFFFSTTTGAAAATSVVGPLVPTDRYWWVQFADVATDDPTSRRLRIGLRDTVPNDVDIAGIGALRASNEPLTIVRPILVPNDTQLVGFSNAMAAGQVLTLRFFFLEFLHAEINPTV